LQYVTAVESALNFSASGWGASLEEISKPGGFKMILEILAIFLLLLLIDCASRISRLIVRRRDVLHYVSKSDRTMDDELPMVGNLSP
jgi:hypothetical protein